MNTTTQSIAEYDRTADEYERFLEVLKEDFQALDVPLFTTDVTDLFTIFLDHLPTESRQHYTCNACRHFVERYGGLVRLDPETGIQTPALWTIAAPDFFYPAMRALLQAVKKAKVTGVFVSSDRVLGQPVTGEWHHMAVNNRHIWKGSLLNAGQKAAEHREEFKMLVSGLTAYPVQIVDQAITLLESESLYRSEKCLGVATWLKEIHTKRNATKNKVARDNMIWYAVATAPAGFCHVKSTMIGTLLDDLAEGMEVPDVSRRFAEKMHPLQYQRPQAAPSAGNIAQAEKVIATLESAGSLSRRFARLDELQTIWKPASAPPVNENGVFGHLTPKGQNEANTLVLPSKTMTWEKFSKTVLPTASKIELLIKISHEPYTVITTASDFDAPPILQWDTEAQRNPFAWYVYHGGSTPAWFNLSVGYCKVTGICYQPSMWYQENTHQGKAVILILDGAKDTLYQNSGNALFPETLKSEYHGIRATIEAYSRKATLEGYESASACGLRLQAGQNWSATVRVTTANSQAVYTLDRWD